MNRKTPPSKADQKPSGIDWINRLAKWRSVFCGWQLGTRLMEDPEAQAVRDHREATLLLRAEVSTLVKLCIEAGAFEETQFREEFNKECERLCRDMERRFPGFRASDSGIEVDTKIAAETVKGWKP